VAWIGVEKGDKVQQGQVLVRLEDQEFRAQVTEAHGEVMGAEARLNALLAGSRPEEIQRDLNSLREAEATLANDKATLTRNESLYAQKLISTQQVDEIRARYTASEQRAAALRETYELSRKGPRKEEIEKARGDLEQAQGKMAFSLSQIEATQIRAPLSGTILERTAEKGELVTAQFASSLDSGGPRGSVVALADLNDLQVEVDISQDDFAKISSIKEAKVTTDAYPDRQYDASIAQVAPEANRQKATVQLRVQVLHPDEFLRPEMNANVNFISREKAAAKISPIEVPFSAVISRNGSRIVLVVSDDRVLEKQIHLIGKKTNGYLIEGISDGATVVIDPPAGLKTGDRIKVKSR
jgi:HlyD family secretion protein